MTTPGRTGADRHRRSAALYRTSTTMRIRVVLAAAAIAAAPSPLAAQSRAVTLIAAARARLSANQLDSADALLRTALDSASLRVDSVNAFVWRAVLWFMRGDESRSATAFHQALLLDTALDVRGLDRMSPRLTSLFEEERLAIGGNTPAYASANVDDKPRRLSGPPVRYTPDLLHRQIRGRALIALTVDTLGHAVPASIDILSTPGSSNPCGRCSSRPPSHRGASGGGRCTQ